MKWPDGWIQALLDNLDIATTSWSIKILDAWQRSTPLEPWTNNPLGVPTLDGMYPAVQGTLYAAFPSMAMFREDFGSRLVAPPGEAMFDELLAQDDIPAMWRAIHALDWPGTKLEYEYPYEVLKLTSQSYQDSILENGPGHRRSTGVVNPQPNPAAMSNEIRTAGSYGANSFLAAGKAFRHLTGGNS